MRKNKKAEFLEMNRSTERLIDDSNRDKLIDIKNLKESIGYGTLSSNLEEKTEKSLPKLSKKYGRLEIFSFAAPIDYWLIFFGSFASVVHGAGFPLLAIILGGMTTIFLRAQNSDFVKDVNSYISTGNNNNTTGSVDPISRGEFEEATKYYALLYALLGVVMFVTSFIQIACWESTAERLVHAIRQRYLHAILRQEISWFDKMQTGDLTARLTDDLERVREGLGDKFSLFIQMIAAFASGFVIGFFYNWQMTLLMVLFTPFLAITNAWMAKITATRTQIEQKKYAVAGAIADETFSSMRTVLSLNGQRHEINRYEAALEEGRKTGLLKYMYMGLGLSSTYIITYLSYGVAFWFASRLVVWDPDFDRGTIFTVFFAVMNGSTALGGALPHLAALSSARGAARHVLKVINNNPKIDPYSDNGILLNNVKGAMNFNNVHFSYPIRKDVKILNGVSFSVNAGQKLALVGSSGCGKSTIVNMILRFYDPDQGYVQLDGIDLKQLNVRSLRDAIGIVSQEPVLFDGTLEENIMLGNEFASREDVNRCCKMANAYDFIQKLPDGLYTRVGERGVQLSGGQKQRIAIARALIRNPKILLLDEATSALDTESEAIVQQALDKAQEGRTTIIVAHRLATIRNVDQILVFKNGEIVERGRHEELHDLKGVFYEMVQNQQINQQQDEKILTNADDVDLEDEDELEKDEVFESSPTQHKLSRSMSSGRKWSSRVRSNSISSSHNSHRSEIIQVREMKNEMEDSSLKPSPMSKIFKMNKENWHYCVLGLIGCTISGLTVPFFALVYSQIFAVFSEPVEQMKRDALMWAGMFLVIGILNSIGFMISANMLGRCGEALTKKLRLEAFRNLLRQDIGFYDDERHNTGKLCTRFATDAPNVRYVFTRLPVVISSVVTLAGAIAIGFFYGLKLALVLLTIVPLIIASGYFEMQQRFGKKLQDTELLEKAGQVASEAVENIRTVQGLNKQLIFYKKYSNHLMEPFKANMHQAIVYGGVFSFSQSLIFFMYAVAFWVGSMFVLDRSMSPIAVFRVFFAIAFCGQSVGQLSSFIPDVVKARIAASLLFHLIEYPTLIDSLSDLGIEMKIKGDVNLKNVYFTYPTRPNTRILNGLTLSLKSGQTLALVGYSGCGKSTIISLLERFYNENKGNISIDGVSIRDLKIHSLREQVCLVSQEPTLFDCTIAENITYGMDYKVPHEQMVEAAEQANIHSFILGLPEGYETRVGEKGAQLSGGQKQRIAIARALIRNPAVLLLDEATSALDSESERVVQDALEKARKNRTCIVIAHRLSTVQNADQIAIINNGKVVEQGTHWELIKKEGIYKSLCQTQILKDNDE